MNKNVMKKVSTILFYCFIGILGLYCFASLILNLASTDTIIKYFKYWSESWDTISSWFVSVLANIALIVFAILVALKSKKAASSGTELKTTNNTNIALLALSLVSFTTYMISFCFDLGHAKENLALYGVFALLYFIVSILYVICLIKPFKDKTNTVLNIVTLSLTLVISLAISRYSSVILSLTEILLILCGAGTIVLENLDSLKALNN